METERVEILPILPIGLLRVAIERAAAERILIENRDLQIRGLPNVETIRVRCTPSDQLEVYAINGEVLAYPVPVGPYPRFTRVTLDDARGLLQSRRRNARKRKRRAEARPQTIVVDSIVWTLARGGRQREAISVDSRGHDIIAAVDAARYSYRMTCQCGRVRFATPNTIHEISACRVCAKIERSNRRRTRRKVCPIS
jgi:hypothetical protein